ncbi:MAG: transposase [Clostridiaceae bacterium]|nr:transposase [Clostridiaceae bacterium]
MAVLNDLWYWVNIRKNYLLPTRKCIGHTKTKSGRTRGIYDRPMSPARRLLNYDCVSEDDKQEICQMLCDLNDAEVTRQILDLQNQLIGLASDRQLLDYVKQEIRQVISA